MNTVSMSAAVTAQERFEELPERVRECWRARRGKRRNDCSR
jgi:hypothetical protein